MRRTPAKDRALFLRERALELVTRQGTIERFGNAQLIAPFAPQISAFATRTRKRLTPTNFTTWTYAAADGKSKVASYHEVTRPNQSAIA